MFLYGATNVSFNLADLFISQVEMLPTRIRTGTFDTLLVRPLGPLFQLVTDEFALRRVGKLAPGRPGPRDCRSASSTSAGRSAKVAVTASMLASGAVIFGSIWVIAAAINIWTDRDHAARQRVHLWRQLPDAVPHRRVLDVDAATVRLPRARWRS